MSGNPRCSICCSATSARSSAPSPGTTRDVIEEVTQPARHPAAADRHRGHSRERRRTRAGGHGAHAAAGGTRGPRPARGGWERTASTPNTDPGGPARVAGFEQDRSRRARLVARRRRRCASPVCTGRGSMRWRTRSRRACVGGTVGAARLVPGDQCAPRGLSEQRGASFAKSGRRAMADGLSPEFVAEDLRAALDAIGDDHRPGGKRRSARRDLQPLLHRKMRRAVSAMPLRHPEERRHDPGPLSESPAPPHESCTTCSCARAFRDRCGGGASSCDRRV